MMTKIQNFVFQIRRKFQIMYYKIVIIMSVQVQDCADREGGGDLAKLLVGSIVYCSTGLIKYI